VERAQDPHPWRRAVKAAMFHAVLLAEERHWSVFGNLRSIPKGEEAGL